MFQTEEKDKLKSSLQCHVCFEDYKVNHHIWQCTSGHSVCESCLKHLHECPFCKAPYEGTRNYAVEDIIRELHGNELSAQPSAPELPKEVNVLPTDERVPLPPPRRQGVSHSPSIDEEFRDMVVVEIPQPRVSHLPLYFKQTFCDPSSLFQQQNTNNVWLKCTSNNIRQYSGRAILGGQDHGRTPLYIGRAAHGNALIPGKVKFIFRLSLPFVRRVHNFVTAYR